MGLNGSVPRAEQLTLLFISPRFPDKVSGCEEDETETVSSKRKRFAGGEVLFDAPYHTEAPEPT